MNSPSGSEIHHLASGLLVLDGLGHACVLTVHMNSPSGSSIRGRLVNWSIKTVHEFTIWFINSRTARQLVHQDSA
jgi:hypothetical protein